MCIRDRRGTYAGDQYDASGRQRGALILYMGPTGAINGTPMVDNVEPRHARNSLKASLLSLVHNENLGQTSTPRCKNGGTKKETIFLTKTTTWEASMLLPSDPCCYQAIKTRGKEHDGSYNSGVPKQICSSVCAERG